MVAHCLPRYKDPPKRRDKEKGKQNGRGRRRDREREKEGEGKREEKGKERKINLYISPAVHGPHFSPGGPKWVRDLQGAGNVATPSAWVPT